MKTVWIEKYVDDRVSRDLGSIKMVCGISFVDGECKIQRFLDGRFTIEQQIFYLKTFSGMDENIRNDTLLLLQQEFNLFQYLFDNHGGLEPRGGAGWVSIPEEFVIDVDVPRLEIMEGGFMRGLENRLVWIRSRLGRMLEFRSKFPPQFVRAIVEIIRREVPDFPLDNDLL